MARPRKPEDPQRWPIACARCNGHYELVATWPDGSICGYCYQAAKRTTGICACGHQGVLPGLIDGRPGVSALQRGEAQRGLRQLRRGSRNLQRWTMPTVRARRDSPVLAHQPRHRS